MRSMYSIIYGPIKSRRLGSSLGINLSPNRECSFNCAYCHVGKVKKKRGVTIKELPLNYIFEDINRGIADIINRGVKFDAITFAGSGEPTNYEGFSEVVDYIIKIKKKYDLKQPIALFTNSSLLSTKNIASLSKISRVFYKLDAVDEATFRKINNPVKGITLTKIINDLTKLNEIELSIAIMPKVNLQSFKSEDGIKLIKKISPAKIFIYDLDHYSSKGYLARPSAKELEKLKGLFEKEVGVETIILQDDCGRGVHPLFGD